MQSLPSKRLKRLKGWIGGLLCTVAMNTYATSVDVKVNGQDGPMIISPTAPPEIMLKLNPDSSLTEPVDWWLMLESAEGWFSYRYGEGWQDGQWPFMQIEPYLLEDFKIPPLSFEPLPDGEYTLYFGIDNNSDGVFDGTWYDKVHGTVVQPQQAPPTSPGLVQIIPTADGKVSLAWLAAVDNLTPATAMQYQVHLSTTANFQLDSSSLRTTVIGQLQTDLTGLTAGQTYYVLVVAVDEEQNLSRERAYQSFMLPSTPTVVNTTITLQRAKEDLGLGTPTIKITTYTFPKTASAKKPTVGAILVGTDSSGIGYLRKVKSVSETTKSIVVETLDTSLAETVTDGSISTVNQLFEVTDAAVPTGSRSWRERLADGSRYSRVEWDNDLLVAEQIDYAVNDDDFTVSPDDQVPGRYRISTTRKTQTTTDQNITWTIDTNFEPSMAVGLEWGPTVPKKVQAVAKGTFNVQAKVEYHFTGKATYSKKVTLFSKTYRSVFFIGQVPVYQETKLSIPVDLVASAQAEINASAEAKVSFGVQIEANYINGSWQPKFTPKYSDEITANLNAQGGISGRLTLRPQITVTFYKAASLTLGVDPYLKSNLGVEAILNGTALLSQGYNLAYGLIQPKMFDVNWGAQCYMSANLKLLHDEIASTGRIELCKLEYPLFNLPKLSITNAPGANNRIQLAASIEDGINNVFVPNSLRWEIVPKGSVTDAKFQAGTTDNGSNPDSSVDDKKAKHQATATFCPPAAGPYVALVSGYGRLGELGRQYVSTTFTVDKPCELTARFTSNPEVGVPGLGVALDASTSDDPAGLEAIINYQWQSSDGQTAEGQQAVLYFDNEGDYTVTLTVTNRNGQTATASQLVKITGDGDYSTGSRLLDEMQISTKERFCRTSVTKGLPATELPSLIVIEQAFHPNATILYERVNLNAPGLNGDYLTRWWDSDGVLTKYQKFTRSARAWHLNQIKLAGITDLVKYVGEGLNADSELVSKGGLYEEFIWKTRPQWNADLTVVRNIQEYSYFKYRLSSHPAAVKCQPDTRFGDYLSQMDFEVQNGQFFYSRYSATHSQCLDGLEETYGGPESDKNTGAIHLKETVYWTDPTTKTAYTRCSEVPAVAGIKCPPCKITTFYTTEPTPAPARRSEWEQRGISWDSVMGDSDTTMGGNGDDYGDGGLFGGYEY